MMAKTLIILLLYVISLAMYIGFCTWWAALFYALVCSQVGVNIMHDGNHAAFTTNKTLSWVAGYTLDMIGSSSVIYRRSHNFGHHGCVNHLELDRAFDTTFPLIRLHSGQSHIWFQRFQHYYSWLLYFGVNFADLFSTYDELVWMSNYPARRAYIGPAAWMFQTFVKVCWLFWALIIPSYLHGYVNIFWPWFTYMTFFSIGYAIFFAVNHWTPDAGYSDNLNINKTNWGVLQVENSVNFALDSLFWTQASGGLNHQIEHHLFPSFAHTRLKEIAPIVQQTCKEFGVRYYQYKSFSDAVKSHYLLLKQLSVPDKQSKF